MQYRATMAGFTNRRIKPGDLVEWDGKGDAPIQGLVEVPKVEPDEGDDPGGEQPEGGSVELEGEPVEVIADGETEVVEPAPVEVEVVERQTGRRGRRANPDADVI